MKNKNKVLAIIFIVIVVVIGSCVIAFSPNLINRLLGNINSTDTETNTAVKTGVILDSDLVIFFDDTANPGPIDVPLKIYNGADSSITINKIITRESCYGVSDCTSETKDLEVLSTPITVDADSDYTYTINVDENDDVASNSNDLIDFGIQYVLDGKIYNIMTTSMTFPNY